MEPGENHVSGDQCREKSTLKELGEKKKGKILEGTIPESRKENRKIDRRGGGRGALKELDLGLFSAERP